MIITVSGVVAYQSPDQIPGAVRAAIVRWAPQAVLLDIADVSALDAASITALLASHQTGDWAGIPVSLINVGPFLRGQLREIGLASLLYEQSATHDGAAVPADASEPYPWSTTAPTDHPITSRAAFGAGEGPEPGHPAGRSHAYQERSDCRVWI